MRQKKIPESRRPVDKGAPLSDEQFKSVIAVVTGTEPLWDWDQLPVKDQPAYIADYVTAVQRAQCQIHVHDAEPREAFRETFDALTNWRATAKNRRHPEDLMVARKGVADQGALLSEEQFKSVIAVVTGTEHLWGWGQLPLEDRAAYISEYLTAVQRAQCQIHVHGAEPREAFREVFYALTNWRATAEIKSHSDILEAVRKGVADLRKGNVIELTDPDSFIELVRSKKIDS